MSASETQGGSEKTSEPEKRVGRMEASEKRRIVEALVLSCSEPISAAKLAEIIPYCDAGEVKDLVNELNTEYAEQDRSFEIWEVAGGFQIRTRAEFSGYLQKLQKERALRLSQAALETLAIIAYRQPVTKAIIERIRGVDSDYTVRALIHRRLVVEQGRADAPGRPILYGTGFEFLERFGITSLDELPALDLDVATRLVDGTDATSGPDAAIDLDEGNRGPGDAIDPDA